MPKKGSGAIARKRKKGFFWESCYIMGLSGLLEYVLHVLDLFLMEGFALDDFITKIITHI